MAFLFERCQGPVIAGAALLVPPSVVYVEHFTDGVYPEGVAGHHDGGAAGEGQEACPVSEAFKKWRGLRLKPPPERGSAHL